MKTQKRILSVMLGLFLAAMPFTALRVLAVDDTTPPSIPTNLSASLTASNQVALSWTASTDDVGVIGYKIMKNSALTANATSTGYLDINTIASTTYTYAVLAFDAMGNVSSSTPQISITTAATSTDTTLPSVPTNLVGTAASSTQINLTWTASTDNVGVTGYNVYKNNVLLANTASTTYSSIGLTPSTTYTFYVKAYDAQNNVSAQSNTVTVATSASETNGIDIIAPSIPANLTIVATTTNSVKLSWTASTDNVAVIGYNIYRDSEWIASIDHATTFTNSGLQSGTAYTYYVRAYDVRGNMSAQSNIVTGTTLASNSNNNNGNGNVNDDNIYQHKNNGNNGNHYGQLKNGNNGKHLGQNRDNNQNYKNGKNKNR